MTTSLLGSDAQASYFEAQRSFPHRNSANSYSTADQRQQFSSFQSEFAARSSSESEQDAGEQSRSNTASDRQLGKSSQQAPSVSAAKPQVSLIGMGLAQTQVYGAQADGSADKSALKSANPKRAEAEREPKSISTVRARSGKPPVNHDRAPLPEDSPNQLLVPNAKNVSQNSAEDTVTLSENAASTQQAADAQIAEDAQVEQAGKSKSTAVQGDLAVAMQIRTGQQDQESGQNYVPDAADAAKTAASSTIGSGNGREFAAMIESVEKPEHHAPETVQSTTAVVDTPTSSHNSADNTSSGSEAKPANGADFQAELENLKAEPLRGAHVQIAGENNQKVDVRLFERNGALSITVRSGDPGLTRALQDHVPELTMRLSSDHFRTETWMPNFSKHSEPNNSGEGNSQKNGSGAQGEQDFNQRRGNKGHQQQPGWIDELEAHPVPFFRKG